VLAQVESLDAFWAIKQSAAAKPPERFEAIEVPKNSANGFVTAFFAVVTGFAMIWHIWWMAILGIASAVLTLLAFGWTERVAGEVSGEELAEAERARLRPLAGA
jgi:cytochrome o ubiquinol oxidase subunit 1